MSFNPKILSPFMGRVVMGMMMIAVGTFFGFIGYALLAAGDSGQAVLGAGFMLVGAVPFLFAPIFVWRGGRLGAEIRGDNLIVHHYFRDTVVHLETPLRVFRSVDATVVETSNKSVVIDDCYFSDQSGRDALFESLAVRSVPGTTFCETEST